ncbi:MAG TPA: hypothetical protein VMU69_17515, partial [Bradyrhizobium sp.]|nr:hypothetical protein [Bradyrhizobium sp.]
RCPESHGYCFQSPQPVLSLTLFDRYESFAPRANPTASPSTSAMPPKAEANSDRWNVMFFSLNRKRHCERSEAIQNPVDVNGLLRRLAPRNDGIRSAESIRR